MNADTRLKLGIALLVIGLAMPVGALFVAETDWPISAKTLVSGILLLGLEILIVPAVALMGKENFDRILSLAKGVLNTVRPAGNVGQTRHKIGVLLFAGSLLFAWIASYVPSWLPEEYRRAPVGQSGAGPDHRYQPFCAGRRLLGQAAGAFRPRRPGHIPAFAHRRKSITLGWRRAGVIGASSNDFFTFTEEVSVIRSFRVYSRLEELSL